MARRESARGTPLLLLLLVIALIGAGLVFLRSATEGTKHHGLMRRQVLLLLASVPVFLTCALVPIRWLHKQAPVLYGVGVAALLLVPFLGVEVNYARRWFSLPLGLTLQPSEVFKPVLVLMLARALVSFAEAPSLRRLLPTALLVLVPFLLVRAEPDLGTALSYAPTAAVMIYVAGLPRRWFVLLAVLGLGGGKLAMHTSLLHDYQKERVETFLFSIPKASQEAIDLRRRGEDREAAALEQRIREIKRNSGYQSHTALTSIGSGGLWGKGIGQGPQNRLGFLPERHNDFVFAVVGEEVGLVGASLLVLGYLLLGAIVLQIAATSRGEFTRLVAVGAGASLCSQAFANMAMTLGLLPITGMPLPFISQGGSSMMASLALVGILVSVGRAREGDERFAAGRSEPWPDPFGFRAIGGEERR